MKDAVSFEEMQAACDAGRLLDFKMPNSRALRDCTASDCFRYGGLKYCGWLIGVGRRIRRGWADGDDYYAGKTVGEVFDEATLGLLFLAFDARPSWWENAPNMPPSDEPEDEFDNRKRR